MDAERPRWLMGQLLAYHRREDKPVWRSLFERFDLSEQELISLDSEAIAGLEPAGELEPLGGRSRSYRLRLRFPRQEHKIAPGTYLEPFTVERDADGSPDPFSHDEWEVLAVHDDEGALEVRVGPSRVEHPPPRALIPGGPYRTADQRAALRELAATVTREGADGGSEHRAARELLSRALPRSSAVPHGADLQEG